MAKVAPKTIAAPDLRPPRLLKLSGVKCAGGMRDGAIDLAPRAPVMNLITTSCNCS